MSNVMDVDLDYYRDLLKNYKETQDEGSLYLAEQMSKQFIKQNIPPEEIVNLHNKALNELYPNLSNEFRRSMDFLLETMIFYGVAYQQYETLREKQLELQSEISVAANMQETFLATSKPEVAGLDIGVISIAAEQLSGDYYTFNKGRNNSLGIALADVIGKGVPAALCMSMIKYAMEILLQEAMSPKNILESLNRVVEKNVDPNMFITMVYCHYAPEDNLLHYASAGHEPGYYYCSKTGEFYEIKARGLVLGVLPDVTYEQYQMEIKQDDLVILLTDGVTECRSEGEFIEVEEVLEVIRQYVTLPAQEIVEKVYKHFERLQDFQLRDDFSLIILRKEV